MAEKEIRKTVEQYMEAWNNNNVDRMKELVHEDARFVGQPPGYGDDRDGFFRLMRDFHDAFSDISTKADNWVVGEDRVALHIKGTGRHTGDFLGVPATNNEMEIEGLMLVNVRDGKIVHDITEIDAMSMLDQLGALPEMGQLTR